MITFIVLMTLIGYICTYRIYKKCRLKKTEFNPFEGNFFEFMSCLLSLVLIIVWVIFLFATQLP